MDLQFSVAAKGFLLSASLIIAIGSQNAFVLKQGIRWQAVFLVATLCFLSEVLLIGLGALGVGTLVSQSPQWLSLAAWGGALFLLIYGVRSMWAAFRQPVGLQAESDGARHSQVLPIVLTTLAVTYLNPHVYLDTVILLGTIAGQYPLEQRLFFVLGAVAASFVWFYGLAFGAVRLAPVLARPLAWRILDAIIALVMWAIAASLVRMALLS